MTTRVALPLALLLTCLVYWSGLHGPLVFDDTQNFNQLNEWLRGERGWLSVVFGNTSGSLGRPLSMATFVLNAATLGSATWGYKLVNLLIHLANGALVYALFKSLASRGGLVNACSSTATPWLALFGASVWMLHPLLVSTVLYVIQRMALLSAMFTLLAMLAYVHGRVALNEGRSHRARVLLLLVPVATVLATLSKENGILAPALCALIEWFVFVPPKGEPRSRLSTAFILAALLLPALLAVALTITNNPLVVGGYANRPFTLDERLLTEARVLWSYVGSLVFPNGPKLGLYHDDYLLSHGLLAPATTLVAIAAWIAVAGLAWALRKSIPGLALGVGIFLVGQSLESSVFPLLIYFEHRNYLPAIGAIWALLSVAYAFVRRLSAQMNHGNGIFSAASVGLVLVLALATAARAGAWGASESLLSQGLQYHPESTWVRMDVSRWAILQSPPRWDVARAQVDHLMQSSDPDTRRMGALSRSWIDCAADSRVQPQFVIQAFQGKPGLIGTDLMFAVESLAELISGRACDGLSPAQMAVQLTAFLDHSPLSNQDDNLRRLRFRASQLYWKAGDEQQALAQARLAYAGRPGDEPIAVFLAGLELRQGHNAAAIRILDAASASIPADDYTGRALVAGVRKQAASTAPAPKQ